MAFTKYSKVDIQVLEKNEVETVQKTAEEADKELERENLLPKDEEKTN